MEGFWMPTGEDEAVTFRFPQARNAGRQGVDGARLEGMPVQAAVIPLGRTANGREWRGRSLQSGTTVRRQAFA